MENQLQKREQALIKGVSYTVRQFPWKWRTSLWWEDGYIATKPMSSIKKSDHHLLQLQVIIL